MSPENTLPSQKQKPPRARPWLLLTLYGLLAALTVAFMFNDGALDKYITSLFYDVSLPASERFFLHDVNPWMWMNDSEIVFDLILLGGLLILVVSGAILAKKPAGKLLLRSGLYMFVTVLVVLLIVNVTLKGMYGRPRPYQTDLWPDGSNPDLYNFYFVWKPVFVFEPALVGDTKSFPSGHTTSMTLFSMFYFVFQDPEAWGEKIAHTGSRKKKVVIVARVMKWVGILTATAGGLLMGFSRIAAGVHFASDIMWALGIVWTVTWLFSRYVFRLYRLKSPVPTP